MMVSSPVCAGYNNRHCEQRPLPFAIVDIPFHDSQKDPFVESLSHTHRFISEGNQNPRQEQEILQPQVRLMAGSYR